MRPPCGLQRRPSGYTTRFGSLLNPSPLHSGNLSEDREDKLEAKRRELDQEGLTDQQRRKIRERIDEVRGDPGQFARRFARAC